MSVKLEIPAYIQLHVIVSAEDRPRLPKRFDYDENKGTVTLELPISITLPNLETTHLNKPEIPSTMASPGLSPFRTALTVEIMGNIVSLPSLLLKPDAALSLLVKGPSQVTPATRTLTQLFGCVVAALTVPLILSWPDPEPGSAGEQQRVFRKAAYLIQGAGEVVIAALFTTLYVSRSDCGLTDTALLVGAAAMVALLGLRWIFLAWKPHLLEGKKEGDGTKKTQ